MPTKKAKTKSPEKSGPLSVDNKQRLPRLSSREKAAAVTGGAVDRTVAESAIRQRLRDEGGIVFDVDAILHVIGMQAGDIRGFGNPGDRAPVRPARLEPAEIVKQAAITCADIAELMDRLRNLHPDLDAWADDMLYRAHGEFLYMILGRVEPDLHRIRAAIDHAGRTVAVYPKKTNSTGNEWTRGRDAIASAVQGHSQPRLSARAANALAVDLLDACGLQSPRKGRRP